MVDETRALLARAEAAIAEAKRLAEVNLAWRNYTAEAIDRMFRGFRFLPASDKPRYPQDMPDRGGEP